MIATVHWTSLTGGGHELWTLSRGLYSYWTTNAREVLYIGKVDGATVRQRWSRSGKEHFWNDLERERRIFKHTVFAGEIGLPPGFRLSRELLADIESLLIKRLDPWGNIQSTLTRISRPGLHVRCAGDWPHARATFKDMG